MKAIDGGAFFDGCVLGLARCDEEHPCPMHHAVENIRSNMRNALRETTVYELATGLKNKESLLMR